MKILVCISRTPDTTAKIAFTDNNTKFDAGGIQFIMNPYDEWYALVRAIELKETTGASVRLILVGGAENDQVIRKGLAYGADDAIRINSGSTDDFYIASQIAGYAREENFDLILTGKETIDYNGSALGGMIAELLGLPFVSLASRLEIAGDQAMVSQEMEEGTAVCRVKLPVLISCQKGLAEMRTPGIRGIMAARTRPLTVREPIVIPELTEVVKFELPPVRKGVRMISPDHPEELVRLLHDEARVI